MHVFSFSLKTLGGRDFYYEHTRNHIPPFMFCLCFLLTLCFSLYSIVNILLCSSFFLPIRMQMVEFCPPLSPTLGFPIPRTWHVIGAQ